MIARGLAANGAKVYITGRRENVLNETAQKNPGLIPLAMDITDKESISNAVEVIEKAEGRLDILVNNAGIVTAVSKFITDTSAPEHANLGPSLFKSESWEDWATALGTNTIAPFFMTTGFSGLLEKGAKKRGEGETSSVINVSSAGVGTSRSANQISYFVSKAGLEEMTKTMAYEFAVNKIPIRVNSLQPGFFPSQMTVSDGNEIDQRIKEGVFAVHGTPPNERSGREAEISSAAVWLSSSGGAYTNGVVLRVDGGLALTNA
ncbi:hypothetical protein VKT23_004824 [Stygiomarasmius scandens]|uniref:Uncharacterized protein n=1 Tax=Marasmiellus scandens TaxID=2682957 RepID=A0ABR1JTD9_9AGAR